MDLIKFKQSDFRIRLLSKIDNKIHLLKWFGVPEARINNLQQQYSGWNLFKKLIALGKEYDEKWKNEKLSKQEKQDTYLWLD